jgi:maltooligosyltrehalose trehalohydrolase
MRDLVDTIERGYAYRGRYSPFRGHRAGSDSTKVPPERFVVFAQNHDQIGNRALGDRLASTLDLERRKVIAGLTVLHPGIPLLFQGEEYGDQAPFPYFVSHSDDELIEAVRSGRRQEFATFDWVQEPPDPQDEATFASARIHPSLAMTGQHSVLLAWHRELLRLRAEVPALHGGIRPTVDADETRRIIVLRRTAGDSEALLAANLGPENAAVEPDGGGWALALHSADRRWGGRSVTDDRVRHVVTLPPSSLAMWLRPTR